MGFSGEWGNNRLERYMQTTTERRATRRKTAGLYKETGRTARVADADIEYITDQANKSEPPRSVPQQIAQMTAVYKLVMELYGTDSTVFLRKLMGSGQNIDDAIGKGK